MTILNNELFDFLFEITLFALLVIKLYQLSAEYIYPALKSYIDDKDKQMHDLEEQNNSLIAQRKHFATQFLNQEKQISLLEQKIDIWYEKWKKKQDQRKEFFKEQEEKICQKVSMQLKNARSKVLNDKTYAEAIKQVRESLSKETQEHHRSLYFKKSFTLVPGYSKKDDAHE